MELMVGERVILPRRVWGLKYWYITAISEDGWLATIRRFGYEWQYPVDWLERS